MTETDKEAAFLREYHLRFERKLKDNEIASLEYWKGQLDKLITMKPEGIAALQMQMKRVSEMMANRVKILKKE
ncbi:MAG: hypothetical protein Q7J31_07780 [Syntrophales bacterium]|nr:hypothetical protein [Syntrophales bacterium]